jgi:hypothetical protein
MYHSVIPLHNLHLVLERAEEFGDGFVLGPLPEWVRADSILKDLNSWDRRRVGEAKLAFRATYDAFALGDPDPEWKGPEPRSIQDAKYEVGVLANFALWLAKPSPAGFTVVVHGPELSSGPHAQRTSTHSPLLSHPRDALGHFTADDLALAARLHVGLVEILKNRRDTGLWTAVRSAWAGLQMNIEAVRCALFWVALEALFGPEDGREITYRLSQRIGFFLGCDRSEARELFTTAKRGYGFRSRIVHGHWKMDPEGEARMAEVEQFLRRSFNRILGDIGLVKIFAERARERFLDDLVFNNGAA